MAWLYNGTVIKAGKSWVGSANAVDEDGNPILDEDDNQTTIDVVHPKNWMIWSDEDKASNGLVWQEEEDTSFDSTFYWAKDIPKSLDDVNNVDEDGNPMLDDDGNQSVTKGLKSTWIYNTKQQANGLLVYTDWYATRKAETDTAIPTDIATYRAAVRTATGTIETAINACTTLDEFKALFVTPVDENNVPTGKAPIFDFPDEVN
jgi:hypothetical protein